ncbi:hypothetical protein ACLMJK_007653 [Lecanora helva]
MASAALDVVGLVSGVIGIVQFIQGIFPESPPTVNKAGSSNLRIAAALNGGGLTEANGHIDIIYLYNELGEQITNNAGGTGPFAGDAWSVDSDSFTDFTLDCKGQQPTYVQIYGGSDAICIPYITQTWPDGTQRGWSGDIGRLCGQSSWSYSNVIVSKDGHKPACTWLDSDHTNGLKAQGMQIHMQDFTDVSMNVSSLDPNHFCTYPAMVFQDHPDPHQNSLWQSGDMKLRARSDIKKRTPAMESHIIGSQDASHSAIALCESPTSWSPDFVSFSEGVFCDMGTKTPWPLCSGTRVDDCYHWDNHTLITGGGHQARVYDQVSNWE